MPRHHVTVSDDENQLLEHHRTMTTKKGGHEGRESISYQLAQATAVHIKHLKDLYPNFQAA